MATEILSFPMQQAAEVIQQAASRFAAKTMVPETAAEITQPFPSPADWRDHWIYFLLVDRFDSGRPDRPPMPAEFPCGAYQGGTFAGIRQRLPYLKALGVGALWLSPVLKNPQWFDQYWGGYGISNFLEIEPRFCSDPEAARADPAVADQEFKALVNDAHSLGIYVILDIVLNHTGDLFTYEGNRSEAPWNETGEYPVYWRDPSGIPQGNWTAIELIPDLPEEAGVWPREFQQNVFFRRRGLVNGELSKGDFPGGLKELATEYVSPDQVYTLRNHLIRVYQYLIAKFDIDGYRIDTLQYVEPDFALVFGNAIREFALSIGKKNFFTFGEVWQDDDEEKIAEFFGRNTEKKDQEFVGVDAALDFPLRKRLWGVAKGFTPPGELATYFDYRRNTLRKIVSSHGDAGAHYVTFLSNHDLNERFHNHSYPNQTWLALACLMTLQGIPCIYYGEEQGLEGRGDRREYVREALWGRADAFSPDHELYRYIQDLSKLRSNEPTLRYGRQYLRACSGNGTDFGYSPYPGGILAFSRILNNRELLIIANAATTGDPCTVHIVVDKNLNAPDKFWQVLFPFQWQGAAPRPGNLSHSPYRTVVVTLAPLEVVVLG